MMCQSGSIPWTKELILERLELIIKIAQREGIQFGQVSIDPKLVEIVLNSNSEHAGGFIQNYGDGYNVIFSKWRDMQITIKKKEHEKFTC